MKGMSELTPTGPSLGYKLPDYSVRLSDTLHGPGKFLTGVFRNRAYSFDTYDEGWIHSVDAAVDD